MIWNLFNSEVLISQNSKLVSIANFLSAIPIIASSCYFSIKLTSDIPSTNKISYSITYNESFWTSLSLNSAFLIFYI